MKQQAILDLELSRQELIRQRLAHVTACSLSVNCLAVLGVPEDASQAEIDRAWRRKAGEVESEGRGNIFLFRQALDAYETLCDRRRLISDYDRYIDTYLSTWLAISNSFRGVFIRLHGILMIWAAPLFFLCGPILIYCRLAGRGQLHVQFNWSCAILLAGLFVLAPYTPFVNKLRIRLQDWYCRRRAWRQDMESCCPHDAGEGFPSERLHELARKSKELDKVGLGIARYRHGVWLVILGKTIVFLVVSLAVGLPAKTSPGEWLLYLGVVIGLLFVVWRKGLRTSMHLQRIR